MNGWRGLDPRAPNDCLKAQTNDGRVPYRWTAAMGLRSAKSLPPDFSIRAGGQHQPRPPQTTSRAKWSVLAAAAVVTMIVTARRHSMSKPCGAVPLLPPGAPPPPFEEQMRQLPVFVLATDQMEVRLPLSSEQSSGWQSRGEGWRGRGLRLGGAGGVGNGLLTHAPPLRIS